MSSLLKIQAGRVSNVSADTYVGDDELLWYDQTGILRLGDGVTPGGIPLNLGGAGTTSTVFNNFLPGITDLYNLGSPTRQWKTLYLSSSTFFVGGNTVTISNSGTLFINGIQIGGSTNIITTGTGTVIIGFTGSRGVQGFQGSQGIQGPVGFTGSAGTGGGTNNLIWTSTGTQRILTGYVDPNGDSYIVRTSQIVDGSFILNLAGFTPTLAGNILPSPSLNWDVPCTGFNVIVTNPVDFLDRWISSVNRLTQVSGSVTTATSSYTTSGPTPTPAAGLSWTQTFNTNGQAVIRSNSTTIAGGSASAIIRFNFRSTSTPGETEFTDSTVTATVNWATPTIAINMADMSGNTFLQSYSQTSYSIVVTGISTPSNYSLSVTGSGGTASNSTGNGNLIFSTPIHKNNSGTPLSVTVTGTFTRPVTVTGNSYSAVLSATDSTYTAAFTYPSFWLWTNSVNQIPTRTDIVTVSSYAVGVTSLGNQVKNFAATINNSAGVPRVFWFGVRSTATQPTSFQTGASANLLSDTTRTTGTVSLSPDSVPIGYTAESFNLYGIILQPGNTYVSIT